MESEVTGPIYEGSKNKVYGLLKLVALAELSDVTKAYFEHR